MKKVLLLCLVLLFVICSCKKYEERLYGYYVLTELKANNVDEINLYHDSLGMYFRFAYENVYAYNNICDMSGTRRDGYLSTLIWTWELIDNNKSLKITSSGGNPPGVSYGPFKNNCLPTWEILGLTNKEIKMKTVYNGIEYFIKLDAI